MMMVWGIGDDMSSQFSVRVSAKKKHVEGFEKKYADRKPKVIAQS